MFDANLTSPSAGSNRSHWVKRHPSDLRLLIVDDDPVMLELFTRMLTDMGHTQIAPCDSGGEALRCMARDAPYDVIMLDMNMPAMDGIEFIRRLAEMRFAGGVVLVSGEEERLLDSIDRLIAYHGLRSLGHLAKPVQRQRLRSVLDLAAAGDVADSEVVVAHEPASVSEVRGALDRGEIVGYYQPQVSLRDGTVTGVECLARWIHPQRGVMGTAVFLQAAAAGGLLPQLGRAMLADAMRNAQQWNHAGMPLQVAVNVTMDDLATLEFPDAAESLASLHNVRAEQITLEIAEGQAMRLPSTALDVLGRLKLKRFRLAVDDFGTGDSSLAQLRDLPFDELKIDRSFVNGVCTEPRLRVICAASLQMAQELRLDTVAEGVEREVDREMLGYMNCDAAQGFLIARPMPADEIMPWAESRRLASHPA